MPFCTIFFSKKKLSFFDIKMGSESDDLLDDLMDIVQNDDQTVNNIVSHNIKQNKTYAIKAGFIIYM